MVGCSQTFMTAANIDIDPVHFMRHGHPQMHAILVHGHFCKG